jgi:hypothetical protein
MSSGSNPKLLKKRKNKTGILIRGKEKPQKSWAISLTKQKKKLIESTVKSDSI